MRSPLVDTRWQITKNPAYGLGLGWWSTIVGSMSLGVAPNLPPGFSNQSKRCTCNVAGVQYGLYQTNVPWPQNTPCAVSVLLRSSIDQIIHVNAERTNAAQITIFLPANQWITARGPTFTKMTSPPKSLYNNYRLRER